MFPGRGQALNWSIEFRGGTEMTVEFAGDKQPGEIRKALEETGFKDAEVVTLKNIQQPNSYILRFGSVSALTKKPVWETTYKKTFRDPDKALREMDKEIAELVSKSFKNFPPKTKH